jgi:GrpB-like predicted nucleotidyltransferase (UPF0157 family)
MPSPIKVELIPHSPGWAAAAWEESRRLIEALEGAILHVHHIGSTAIAGIHAKPVVDLLPVVRSVSELDAKQPTLIRLGYDYWGEYGIPGRRYGTFDEPSTGRRKFQLHCFEAESHEIERHLAFRDYLRANREVAQAYDQEKQRCGVLHPDDSHAYSNAKAAWITARLPAAMAFFRASG